MEEKKTYLERLNELVKDRFWGSRAACAAHFGLKRDTINKAIKLGDNLNEEWRNKVDAYDCGALGMGKETLPIDEGVLKAYELGLNKIV